MFQQYLSAFRDALPLGDSFDLKERLLVIGGRRAVCYFVDGLTDGKLMQWVIDSLIQIRPQELEGICTSQQFAESHLPFLNIALAGPDCDSAITQLYTGLVPLIIEDLDKIIILDVRAYP